jgi:serine/threonine-protein kinase RsbW
LPDSLYLAALEYRPFRIAASADQVIDPSLRPLYALQRAKRSSFKIGFLHAMPEAKTLRLSAILGNVAEAVDFVVEAAQALGFDEQALYHIRLAVDEACANVVEHAYRGTDRGEMEISCWLQDRDFVIRIRDWGQGFDLDSVPQPDLTVPLEERSLGGLGLYLIRHMVDELQYYSDSVFGNEMVMTKRLKDGDDGYQVGSAA